MKRITALFLTAFLALSAMPAAGAAAPEPAGRPAGGYINLAYIYNANVNSINNMDFNALTHVNYAFGLIYNTEYERTGNSRESWNAVNANPALEHTVYLSDSVKNGIRRIVALKKERNLDLKILPSIGGDGARGFSPMARTPESRAKFIQSCLDIIDEFELDGIDVDWEFPCMDGWGNGLENSPEDRGNFTLLVKELRQALGDGYLLTIAGSANVLFPNDWTDLAEIIKHLDFINLMTYDFHYETSYFGYALGSSRSWPAGRVSDDYSVDFSVFNYVSAGCPRGKINVGYTTGAVSLPSELRASGSAPSVSGAKWAWVNNALSASGWNAAPNNANPIWMRVDAALDGKTYNGTSGGVTKQIEFHKEWDRLAGLATVIAYDLTDDPGRTQKLFVLSYLDEQGLKARTDYIKETGLGGSFFWQYGGDTQSWLARTVGGSLGVYSHITVNKDKALLSLNGAETLAAYISPAIAAGNSVVWSSDNEQVATVSSGGEVTAQSLGECVITATASIGGYQASCSVTVGAGELAWPYTPTEWVLDRMAGIDTDAYGYEQYDVAHSVKNALRVTVASADRLAGATSYAGLGGDFWANNDNGFPASARNEFLLETGRYYGQYQELLDQEAEMVGLWLADLATPRPDESWERHMARISQTQYMMEEAPGYYYYVEKGRRISLLGAEHYADNEYADEIAAWQELYRKKFLDECYAPAKEAEKKISYMNPADSNDVIAARSAYDALDSLAKSSVMNYQLLTRAEGNVNPDGSDKIPGNLKYTGMRKPTGADSGFTAANQQTALADLQAALPGTAPWYIWIAGVSNGQMMAGTTDWDELEASGSLKYPKEYYQKMGVSLVADAIGDAFFQYLDDNFPDAEVYLQVENMNRLIEPQMDILSYRAKQYNCIKGFAIDVEWYNHASEDCGLKVSDYRARKWNEDIYSHWGSDYSLCMKHYDAGHLPDTYRGGGDGRSNPIVFVDDGQGSGSWDGSHGGQYAADETGNGSDPGHGGSWALFTQYAYPNTVIFQTGYANDSQWIYGFEDPMVRNYGSKIADVMAPDQLTGVAWVNFDRNDPRVFPNQTWRTPDQQVSDLAARSINYLSNYNGNGSSRLLARTWGYVSAALPPIVTMNNQPSVYDAQMIRNTRLALQKLTGKGANPSGFTGHAQYARFEAIEPRALDVRISALHEKIVEDAANSGGFKAARDAADIQALIDAFEDFTDAQKGQVAKINEYGELAALLSGERIEVSASPPAIAETLGAYLSLTASGAPAGVALSARLLVDGEEMYQTAIVGGSGRMHIPSAPAAGQYKLIVSGTGYYGDCMIEVAPYGAGFWTAAPCAGEAGALNIKFSAAISSRADFEKSVKIGGVAYNAAVAGSDTLAVDGVMFGSLAKGQRIVVSGVRFAELFPSYSFNFTITV